MVDVCRPELVDWDETDKGVAVGINQGPSPETGVLTTITPDVMCLLSSGLYQRDERRDELKGLLGGSD
jgi:hypothetical protein